MLAPGSGRGRQLYNAINSYRERILRLVPDEQQRKIIASNLTTELPKHAHAMGKNWQEYMFEDMPVAAAVTLLSKLQSDIRYAEGEVLHTLVSNIDVKDIRVNKLDAFVIPEKTTLYPGEVFTANIVMAAVDTTQQPEIYVNGNRINSLSGKYSFTASGVGEHSFAGYLLTHNAAGETIRREFRQKYNVIPAPSGATVAADLMNVLYAGYQNPMSVSQPTTREHTDRWHRSRSRCVSCPIRHRTSPSAPTASRVVALRRLRSWDSPCSVSVQPSTTDCLISPSVC